MGLEQKRLELQKFLESIEGVRKAYYSPPSGVEMEYPCIVYHLGRANPTFADNIPYLLELEWEVTVIDEDPDSEIAYEMMRLPKCTFDRSFYPDDLNHFVFSLYF